MITDLARKALQRWTSPVDPDAYLAALHPRWSTRPVGVIERITPLTASSAAIRIRPGRSWAGHRAGQFVTLGVDVDGVRHHRCYSITSAPGERGDAIEIGVQQVPGGIVSSHLVERARPGDVVQLPAADGDFTVPADPHGKLLLVAGGSGITPLLGMLRALAAAPGDVDAVLLHHVPTADRAMFAAELAELEATSPWLRVDTQLTRCGGRRLDASTLDERCPDWRERRTFACGPDALLDVVTDHWDANGLVERLHLERFTPSRLLAAVDGAPARVCFGSSGLDVVTDGDATLLEVAEGAGLTPATGCRTGVCHTCTTPLLAGCARDRRDGRLIDAGAHVQLCVSVPAGDLVLDL